jgi:hypothetical protein
MAALPPKVNRAGHLRQNAVGRGGRVGGRRQRAAEHRGHEYDENPRCFGGMNVLSWTKKRALPEQHAMGTTS